MNITETCSKLSTIKLIISLPTLSFKGPNNYFACFNCLAEDIKEVIYEFVMYFFLQDMGKYVADIGGVTTAAFLDVEGKKKISFLYFLSITSVYYFIHKLYNRNIAFIHLILEFLTT